MVPKLDSSCETFQPLDPNLLSPPASPEVQKSPSPVPLKTRILEVRERNCDRKEEIIHTHTINTFDIKEEPPEVEVKSEKSDCESSSAKRKPPDKSSSTGTLKLVFKRRTTDNFVVKNALEDSTIPQDMRPVVNLEKSDSEYEFDSRNDVCNSQPVIVRRRTASVSATSRQTSLEVESEYSSSISSHVRDQHNSSDEEDEEEENDNREEDINDERSDNEVNHEQLAAGNSRSKTQYHVSFDNDVVEDDDDAFIDADEQAVDVPVHRKKWASRSSLDVSYSNISSFSEVSDETMSVHSRRKSTQILQSISSLSQSLPSSVASPHSPDQGEKSVSKNLGKDEVSCKLQKRGNHSISQGQRSGHASVAFPQSPRASPSERNNDYIPESPVSNMEKEAAKRGLPNSSLFATPNKSLLQTDAMFNSSSEDEDSSMGGSRLVSSFEIDNKDPQNSMINDSVRSAINSVLNNDDNDDSQTSWSSCAHHPPSIHQPTSTGHDADLDAAVQSILNS